MRPPGLLLFHVVAYYQMIHKLFFNDDERFLVLYPIAY